VSRILPPDETQSTPSPALTASQRAAVQSIVTRLRETHGHGAVLLSGATGAAAEQAAAAIAAQLGVHSLRVDLRSVANRHAGEAEKSLDAVFKDAEHTNAVLFFDEAEALLGKRSGVKDAHDRYANIEVSYLLDRIEAFGGLVILATNTTAGIDPAVLRRLRYRTELPQR
jgi:SpoVK/Ycf46/Vps4 family AAA+-type ATPase